MVLFYRFLLPLICYSDNFIAVRTKNATLAFVIAVVYCAAVVLVSIPMSYYFAGMGAILTIFGMHLLYYVFYIFLLYKKEGLRPI